MPSTALGHRQIIIVAATVSVVVFVVLVVMVLVVVIVVRPYDGSASVVLGCSGSRCIAEATFDPAAEGYVDDNYIKIRECDTSILDHVDGEGWAYGPSPSPTARRRVSMFQNTDGACSSS